MLPSSRMNSAGAGPCLADSVPFFFGTAGGSGFTCAKPAGNNNNKRRYTQKWVHTLNTKQIFQNVTFIADEPGGSARLFGGFSTIATSAFAPACTHDINHKHKHEKLTQKHMRAHVSGLTFFCACVASGGADFFRGFDTFTAAAFASACTHDSNHKRKRKKISTDTYTNACFGSTFCAL